MAENFTSKQLSTFREAFNKNDSDGDGKLNSDEVLAALEDGNVFLPDEIREEIQVDIDCSDEQELTFDEFVEIISKHREEAFGAEDDDLTDEQRTELTEAFELYDENRDKKLDSGELVRALRAMGIPLSPKQSEQIQTDVDMTDSQVVDFRGFKKYYLKYNTVPVPGEQELIKAFRNIDQDKSGSISADELTHYMQAIGDKMSDDEIKQMLRIVDQNGDGEVDYKEFAAMMTGGKVVL